MNSVKQEDGSTTPLPNMEYQQSNFMPQPPMFNQGFDINQPWWIPTNEDTGNETYAKWYESAYKATLAQAAIENESLEKKTMKFKRKHEVVEERIADAQKELSELMKPLKCDLCNAVMNTTLQANNHYHGKNHQKKVSMFLNQSAKKLKTEEGPVSSSTSDWNSYCEVCKIWFTSQTDATQHYAGKKHNKAAFGISKKKSTNKNQMQDQTPYDPRFGIGIGFQQDVQTPQPQLFPENTVNVNVPPVQQFMQPSVSQQISLQCDLCGIKVNRIDQLEVHFKGTKHLKQLKQRGLVSVATESAAPTPKFTDFSSYRTPSGLYYCAPCNLSVATEVLFAQHIEGKKHKSQINPKQTKKSTSDNQKQR